MPLGVSYQPGTDVQFDQGTGGNVRGVRGVSPQEAVRLLSLRIPQNRTAGASGLAPLPLLNAAGGGGSDLDTLLKALLQAFGQGGRGTGSGMGSMGGAQATPRVVPGFGGQGEFPGPVADPTSQVSPDQLNQLLDTDLGGGRTLRAGGGFAGNHWKNQQMPTQGVQPLF